MIEITGLTKIFGQGTINEKIALQDISLSLLDGEFVTVIGGNGAGKSTLMNSIAGVHETDKGKIVLDGLDITNMPEYRRSNWIGRVFQDPSRGTAFDMTIEQNLAIAFGKGKPRGFQPGLKRSEQDFFREQLTVLGLGLENRLKHKVGLLSGGQRQALTLLMATIVKPKLLLLDEHTAALDPPTAKTVLELTDQFVAENSLTTFMITHNMKAALTHGTRTIMMHEGRIILDLKGAERDAMTVEDLIEQFEKKAGEELDNDRMLLG